MNYKVFTPSSDLAQLVKYYFYISIENPILSLPLRAISTGFCEIFLFLDGTNGVEYNQIKQSLLSGAFILGNKNYYHTDSVRLNTSYETFGVVLNYNGLQPFCGPPDSNILNKLIPLGDIFGNNSTNKLCEQINSTNNNYDRVLIFESFLRIKLQYKPWGLPPGLLSFMNYNYFGDNIMKTCHNFGIGRRTLERKLKNSLGLSPLEFLHIKRINKVFTNLNMVHKLGWAQFAYYLGYFDQSHFIKDFKSVIGMPPELFYSTIPNYCYSQKYATHSFIPTIK